MFLSQCSNFFLTSVCVCVFVTDCVPRGKCVYMINWFLSYWVVLKLYKHLTLVIYPMVSGVLVW